jgi:uncharacterized protein (DUF2236 family)
MQQSPKIPLPGHGSVSWKINRERLVLLGGPAAAVLQVAHPVVARGVAAHSSFRTDSVGRLHRTLEAVYTVSFGTAEDVDKVRSGVARAHQAVKGEGYSAFDPAAQLWVLATLIMGSVQIYERFIGPLGEQERDALLQENEGFAWVFGLDPQLLWHDWQTFENYWKEMIHGKELGSLPLCAEVAQAVICPDAPRFMKSLSPVIRALALEMIPPGLSARLGLGKSRLQSPLWTFLDRGLPLLKDFVPDRVRFAPHYLRAVAGLKSHQQHGPA